MKRLYRSVLGSGLGLGLLLAAPGTGFAKDPQTASSHAATAAAPSPDYSPVLKLFAAQGVTINYLGRKLGLDGWLLVKDSKIQVIYVTPDGQGAVLGTLYAPDGSLATGEQLAEAQAKGQLPASLAGDSPAPAVAPPAAQTAAPPAATVSAPTKPGEAPSEHLWKQVEASTYIKFGSDSAPVFYVIMDPRCEFCHKFYTTLTQKYLPAKVLQLRVIPVGILGPDSVKEAAQIVSSPDMAKSWIMAEQHNVGDLPDVAPGANAKLDSNHKIMQDWKLNGTPAAIYRNKDGKVKVVLGVPEDMDAIVADLGPAHP